MTKYTIWLSEKEKEYSDGTNFIILTICSENRPKILNDFSGGEAILEWGINGSQDKYQLETDLILTKGKDNGYSIYPRNEPISSGNTVYLNHPQISRPKAYIMGNIREE